MKVFRVENTRRRETIRVTLHNPPYENENILYKTGWKEKDCIIEQLVVTYEQQLETSSIIDADNLTDEENE